MAEAQDSKDIHHPHLTTSFQDVDETLAKVGDTHVFSERLSPAEDRRLLRKIDLWYVTGIPSYRREPNSHPF